MLSSRSQLDSPRLSGAMQHASPFAIKIVLKTLMDDHYQSYLQHRSTLMNHKLKALSDAARMKVWVQLRDEMASFFYFMWSMAPYSRGAPTTGLMLHQALWLALFQDENMDAAILCVPPLGDGVYTDWEAMSVEMPYFRDTIYTQLFAGHAKDMLKCFDRLLVKQGFNRVYNTKKGNKPSAAEQSGTAEPVAAAVPRDKERRVKAKVRALKGMPGGKEPPGSSPDLVPQASDAPVAHRERLKREPTAVVEAPAPATPEVFGHRSVEDCSELRRENQLLGAQVSSLNGELTAARAMIGANGASKKCPSSEAGAGSASDTTAEEARREAKSLRIKLRLAELKLKGLQSSASSY